MKKTISASLWPQHLMRARSISGAFWIALVCGAISLAPQSLIAASSQKLITAVWPTPGQRIASLPVPVEVRFGNSVQPGTFSAHLNGSDVTARFVVRSDGATGSLSVSDGIRPSLRPDGSLSAPNTLVFRIESTTTSRRIGSTVVPFLVRAPIGLPTARAEIPTTGGGIDLPTVATVRFPAGSFSQSRSVSVGATAEPDVDQVFQETGGSFSAAVRLPYEVRINVGESQPLQDVEVSIAVPDSFRASIPSGSEIRVLGRNYWADETEAEDTVELLPDRFSPAATWATLVIPRYFFSNAYTADGTYEAVLLLTTTPTGIVVQPLSNSRMPSSGEVEVPLPDPFDALITNNDDALLARQGLSSAAASGGCDGATLQPPLNPLPPPKSGFGPRDPSVGAGDYHYGTDYPVVDGTPVLAMAGGVVKEVRNQTKTINGRVVGWGLTVLVVGGSGATRYAHLQSSSVAIGDTVQAGDLIGLSDSSGGAVGHPHLHVEYSPDGKNFSNDGKRDPAACIGNSSGNIRVRDNGNIADDAFSVALNGSVICTTTIGGVNSCGTGALRPGTATLKITAVTAPDNVGTYELTLSGGLTFSDGGSVRSGTIPQGGSATFTISVP